MSGRFSPPSRNATFRDFPVEKPKKKKNEKIFINNFQNYSLFSCRRCKFRRKKNVKFLLSTTTDATGENETLMYISKWRNAGRLKKKNWEKRRKSKNDKQILQK